VEFTAEVDDHRYGLVSTSHRSGRDHGPALRAAVFEAIHPGKASTKGEANLGIKKDRDVVAAEASRRQKTPLTEDGGSTTPNGWSHQSRARARTSNQYAFAKIAQRSVSLPVNRHFPGRRSCSSGMHRTDTLSAERVTEICHFGRQVLVSFSIENRARAPFEVEAVTLNKGEQKTKQGILSARTIAFDETTRGVEYLVLPEGDSARGPYQLTVSEKGGQHRVVTVNGITR
jgi:hypothetical protein